MKTINLNDINSEYFDEAWSLYTSTFPTEERRTLLEQKIVIKDDRFNATGFIEDNKLVAILYFWDFEKYTFLEHFAIIPSLRGKSYGSLILEEFLERYKNIVLEIEPLRDEICKRRLAFYEKFDFVVNEYKHYQIPFRKEDESSLELLLLSHKKTLAKDEYLSLYKIMKDSLTII